MICPRCGAKCGQRNPNPVKCPRCWFVLTRPEFKEPNPTEPKEK